MIGWLRYRHYRVKIFIMVLFHYLLFHCSGLLWIVGLYSEQEHGAGWNHPAFWAVSVSLIFQILGIFVYSIMSFNILFTHSNFMSDLKWIYKIKVLAKVGTVFYALGIIFMVVRAIQVETLFFELYLMVMNKAFLFTLVFTIVYDLNRFKNRNQRLLLYGEILQCFSCLHALLLTYAFFVFMFEEEFGVALALFVVSIAFWIVFGAAIQYSFIGQHVLPICHISRVNNEQYLFPYKAPTIAYHYFVGGFFILLITMLPLNFVHCLSENSAFESLYAIKSYGFLNFVYCVIAAIEFSMVGLPNVRYPLTQNEDDESTMEVIDVDEEEAEAKEKAMVEQLHVQQQQNNAAML